MSLSPLLALGVPELDRDKTSPGHAQVRSIENVTSLAVHIHRSIAEPKDLEGREFAASRKLTIATGGGIWGVDSRKMHGHELGTAFL